MPDKIGPTSSGLDEAYVFKALLFAFFVSSGVFAQKTLGCVRHVTTRFGAQRCPSQDFAGTPTRRPGHGTRYEISVRGISAGCHAAAQVGQRQGRRRMSCGKPPLGFKRTGEKNWSKSNSLQPNPPWLSSASLLCGFPEFGKKKRQPFVNRALAAVPRRKFHVAGEDRLQEGVGMEATSLQQDSRQSARGGNDFVRILSGRLYCSPPPVAIRIPIERASSLAFGNQDKGGMAEDLTVQLFRKCL